MALTLSPKLRTALGLSLGLHGGLGGLTYRRQPRTGSIVYYERRAPGALSPKQLAHRAKFLLAYDKWWSLTDDQRANWETAARVASTRQIGSHLFLRVWWKQDTHTLDQFKRHYALDLALPGPA